MRAELLLDTGGFVAILNRNERRHRDCVRILESCRGPILTTEAVLTETLHLLDHEPRARRLCLDFFARQAIFLIPSSLKTLVRVSELMEKYRDVPMDYADATLVALAEESGIGDILTLDRQDFSVFRWRGARPFNILPEG